MRQGTLSAPSRATVAALAADLRCALDPVVFARERLEWEPDDWQAAALRSTAPQVLLNCSRQSGKSTTTGIRALHQSVYWPGSLTLLFSPSLRQSKELFAKVTFFLRRLDEPPRMDEDNALGFTLANGSRVVCLPGTAATVRGFSAPALVIEDEAAWCEDALHFAIRPMLAVSGGRLMLMSTPNGRRGHFFEAWENGGDAWERTEVPASLCPRISAEFLENERRAMGETWFRQEYECAFMETADQVFSYDDVRRSFTDTVQPLFGVAA